MVSHRLSSPVLSTLAPSLRARVRKTVFSTSQSQHKVKSTTRITIYFTYFNLQGANQSEMNRPLG